MVDEYLKNKLNVKDSRYILIDMKNLRVDVLKEKAELRKYIIPFNITDSFLIENQEDINLLIDEIIKNYKK